MAARKVSIGSGWCIHSTMLAVTSYGDLYLAPEGRQLLARGEAKRNPGMRELK